MKRNIAKLLWKLMVIIFILIVVSAPVLFIGKILPYYSYPQTEAKIVSVHNYQKSNNNYKQEIEYGSSIKLEYMVNGKKVNGWLEYSTTSIRKEGDIIRIAYNPDNPLQCRMVNEKGDILMVVLLVAVIIYILWICIKISRKNKNND